GKVVECLHTGECLKARKIIAKHLDESCGVGMTIDAQQRVDIRLAAWPHPLSYRLSAAQHIIGKGMLQRVEPHHATLRDVSALAATLRARSNSLSNSASGGM